MVKHTLGQTFEGNFGRGEVGAEKKDDMTDTWRWQEQNNFCEYRDVDVAEESSIGRVLSAMV